VTVYVNAAYRLAEHLCYPRGLNIRNRNQMIETNPILAQIADLKGRVESLRGYL